MSAQGELYFAQKLAENQTAAARATRVKEFIANSDRAVISDLFATIRDAVIDCGAEESLAVARHFQMFVAALSDVEAELRN